MQISTNRIFILMIRCINYKGIYSCYIHHRIKDDHRPPICVSWSVILSAQFVHPTLSRIIYFCFFLLLGSMSTVKCMVKSKRRFLFFFFTYKTRLVVSWKRNIDDPIVRSVCVTICLGSYLKLYPVMSVISILNSPLDAHL